MIKKLRVTVDGKPYEVTVEMPDEGVTALVAPVASPGQPPPFVPAPTTGQPAAPVHSSIQPGDVPSPLAGRVAAIAIKEGDAVQAGDQLLTLEAMKMNTFVFAPAAGKVLELKVAVGDAIGEGQTLLKIG
jgi:biotin carboxyl carrier protein